MTSSQNKNRAEKYIEFEVQLAGGMNLGKMEHAKHAFLELLAKTMNTTVGSGENEINPTASLHFKAAVNDSQDKKLKAELDALFDKGPHYDKTPYVETTISPKGMALSCLYNDGIRDVHVEASLRARGDKGIFLSVRYNQAGAGLPANAALMAPSFIAKLFDANPDQFSFEDGGLRLTQKTLTIKSKATINAVLSSIKNQGRRLPIIIVSERPVDDRPDGEYPIVPENLATKLAGLAHVVKLPAGWVSPFCEQAGEELEVFGGGIRLYRPYESYVLNGKLPAPFLAKSDFVDGKKASLDRMCLYVTLENRQNGAAVFPAETYKAASESIQNEAIAAMCDNKVIQSLMEKIQGLEKTVHELTEENETYVQIAQQEALEKDAQIAELSKMVDDLTIRLGAQSNGVVKNHESAFQKAARETLPSRPYEAKQLDSWLDKHYADEIHSDVKVAKIVNGDVKHFCSSIDYVANTLYQKNFGGEQTAKSVSEKINSNNFSVSTQDDGTLLITNAGRANPEYKYRLVVRPDIIKKRFILVNVVPEV
ncbi:MAG TPA: hypothetical protein DCY07_05305 [Rhodospirillaceae bacterium]|nr:hypothetical protein [Rhodospirillaceae bacterium]